MYIKSFKLFEAKTITNKGKDGKKKFGKKVNYKLLEDLRELSLDIIDKGFDLIVNVGIHPVFNGRKGSEFCPVCSILINHDVNDFEWYGTRDGETFLKNSLTYKFRYQHDNDEGKLPKGIEGYEYGDDYTDYHGELEGDVLETIKTMYPDNVIELEHY